MLFSFSYKVLVSLQPAQVNFINSLYNVQGIWDEELAEAYKDE